MVQEQSVILNKVSRFYESAKQLLPIKKILLYGSYAKGTATENSDIDVTIEPKCIFWDEYLNHDKASILAEIINKSIEIA
ncbi:MAG: nucleotidyltransferase domain-containing protein [Sedimentisphaerales bacterium]|nr:nucleotidyltransferase domain-containing protein [Sedimentisphaerales bacterium]